MNDVRKAGTEKTYLYQMNYEDGIARHYNCYEPNTCIISNGFATMGIGLPGAVAAKLINPDKKVLIECW